jgi:adenylosuccinate lyase
MGTIYENIVTWHERSIEQSSAERLVHAEMIVLAGYMVRTLTRVVEGLEVFPERMLANMEITRGAIYSEAIQLLLRERGVDPEIAYRAVQEAAQKAMDGEGHTKTNILADPRVEGKLTDEDLDRVMDPWAELQHVGAIYERHGI